MEFFPYRPREHQTDFVEAVDRVMKKGGHIVLESGTGTGKTVCALTAAVQTALTQGKKVVYLTRTNSQQRQVLLELRRLNDKRTVFGMGVQGRQSTCPLFRRDPDLKEGSAEELSKLCAEKKKRTVAGKDGGCRFYENVMNANFQEIEEHCHKTLPTVEEFVTYCDSRDLCAYELSKELMENATVVTAPYPYMFVPFARRAFLENMNTVESDLIVIIDEAHNLPDYAREILSAEMSRRFFSLVRKEADEYGDPEVLEGVSIMDVVEVLEKLLDEALKEYLIDDDGLIPPGFLQEGLLQAFTTTSRTLKIAAKALMTHGEIIREAKQEAGRLPRSYIFSLGALINFWLNLDEEYYVRLVVGGDNPRFEASCLDPSLACGFFHDCHASLHMSGTLAPLYEYRDSIGLPKDSVLRTFPSPFPKENRMVLYAEDVTTKFEEMALDEEILGRMIDHTISLCNVIDRNTVVFFPSYSLMDRFLGDGAVRRIHKPVLLEERGMPQAELMDTVSRFKLASPKGSVLFAVMGGRISEGIDFPDKELELAILVGIPFPKPTAKQRALLHYYEIKFGKGWEYTVKVPAARKMMQAIGRLIRTENDVGAAVILDKRAKQFADRIDLKDSQSVPNEVLNFFRAHGR